MGMVTAPAPTLNLPQQCHCLKTAYIKADIKQIKKRK